MSRISTHVLDTMLGMPAGGVAVTLERFAPPGQWEAIAAQKTDTDGRCPNLLPEGSTLSEGQYRLRFDTGSYHAAQSVQGLYPTVEITVTVRPGNTHLHIPLLLSPNGYTTYKGS
jgi:5-hydroxyisourate hydrolase